MPTPHSHQELARRLLPIAAYVREYDVDGQLAEVAVRGLAETLGIELVVVDPNPMVRLVDLGRALLLHLQDLLRHGETRSGALRIGLSFADLLMGTLKKAGGQQGRRRHGPPVRRLQVGDSR